MNIKDMFQQLRFEISEVKTKFKTFIGQLFLENLSPILGLGLQIDIYLQSIVIDYKYL